MALRKRRTVMSVNRNIDTRLDQSGMNVDMEIQSFMHRKKKSVISGRKKLSKDFFEIGNGRRTLLG